MTDLSPRALDVGREFTVQLPMMDAAPASFLCRVLHCQPAPNGSFTIGGRFIREIPDAASTEPAAMDEAPLRQAS